VTAPDPQASPEAPPRADHDPPVPKDSPARPPPQDDPPSGAASGADTRPPSADAPPVPEDSPAASAPTLRGEWPVLAPLLVAAFCTYAYFIGPPAWNQNSRLALTRALVERGTTIIDEYHATTGDKSLRDGHFYSDKAPGASLLALPAYALYYAATRATGGDPPEVRVVPVGAVPEVTPTPEPEARAPGDRLAYNQSYRTALYVSRLLSTSLLAVAGLAALYLLARRQLARAPALLLAATYGLATPALIYSAAFYGHQPCADLLLLGLALPLLSEGTGHPRAAALAAGACLGLAVVCEYPAAVPAALLAAFALHRRGLRFAAWLAAGALPCAAALAAYHVAAFGHPLKTGYDFVYLAEFAEGMRVRYGIHAPDPTVLLELLFGRFRGLFYLAPVLLVAAWGLAAAAAGPAPKDMSERTWPTRPVAWVSLTIVAFYLALNSGYYMWDGGAAVGPRHCVPMLPFLALGLVPALRLVPGAVKVLALVSAAQMLVAAAGAPEAPQHGDPLWNHAWPHLLRSEPGYGGATNLGLLLGLPGVLSLAPLVALWWWTWQISRERVA
jgi:hypothetical protein